MKTSILFVLAVGLLLTACGSGDGNDNENENENENGGNADHEALAACGSETCGNAQAKRLEASPYQVSNMACAVEGMRDRTSGVYKVTLQDTHTVGSDISTFTIFVTPSGEAEVAVHRSVDFLDDNGNATTEETYEPTERCSLKPAAFFESCATVVKEAELAPDGEVSDAADAAFDCLYPSESEQELPWFESCEELAPTCE